MCLVLSQHFSGSHHYIVDYLADEVLKRQDEHDPLVFAANLYPFPHVRLALQ